MCVRAIVANLTSAVRPTMCVHSDHSVLTKARKPVEATMLVKDVMTRQVEWVDPEITLLDAAKKMHDKDIGALPVGEDDRIIGMVTDRDITCRGVAQNLSPASTPVRKVMTENLIWCFDDQTIEDAAHLMEGKRVRRLAVMNPEKRLVGFLSVGDLAHRAHGLSGEILDEVTA